jgi:ornithine cyclodeaminase/alanine dehydrogenase-like protein (mu-crystallin family)
MLLEEADIRAALRWDELIVAMERALAAFSSGRVLQLVRNVLTIEEGKRYLGIMPAVAEDAMGLKLISFYPSNAGTGVPTHMAMVPLFRPETGGPPPPVRSLRGNPRRLPSFGAREKPLRTALLIAALPSPAG